jgi:hypothetical protein
MSKEVKPIAIPLQHHCNTIATPLQQVDIQAYNLLVKQQVIQPEKQLLIETAVLQFKQKALQQKWNEDTYNQNAIKWNQDHNGYFIALKGANAKPVEKSYYYINFPMMDGQAKAETMLAYEQAIDKYNEEVLKQKALDPKCELQTVKGNTKLVFEALLHIYTLHFKKDNDQKMMLGQSTAISRLNPPKILVNNTMIGKQWTRQIPKTVYNHIRRMIAAGILTEYKFRSHKRPYHIKINPKILQISEGNFPKSQNAENQFFKTDAKPNLPNDILVQETLQLKKDKKKELQVNSFERNADAVAASELEHLNKNTNGVKNHAKEDFTGAAAENSENIQKISSNLKKRIISTKELAVNLENRVYENDDNIRLDVLRKEVMYGSMTQHEFWHLCVQEFWKAASKIYKYRSQKIYAGVWTTTINRYSDKLFQTTSGHLLQKDTMLTQLEQYRWRIGMAQNLFRRYKIEPMIPTLYFDPMRSKKSDLSFAGTKKLYKSHENYQEKEKKELAKRKKEVIHRQSVQSGVRKIERKVHQMIRGTISLEELLIYANTNISPDIINQLPGVIEQIKSNKKVTLN